MGFFSKIFGDDANETAAAPVGIADHRRGYTFLDVETPNKRNDTICSIGVIKTDVNGQVVDKMYTLVDPEVKFSSFNIGIHGIRPEDVVGSPTFDELWNRQLSKMLADSILVAHNATFDLTVLSKSLKRAGIPIPDFDYVCTIEFGGSALRGYESCKLDAMCKAIGHRFDDHHHAFADTEACMKIFWKAVEASGSLPQPSRYTFNSEYSPFRSSGASFEHCDKTKALQCLKEYMETAVSDNQITTDEALGIQELIFSNEDLSSDASLSQISDTLQDYLQDSWIDHEESAALLSKFSYYLDPLSADDGTVEIAGKNFMLTGDFSHGSKDDVRSFIAQKGGSILKSVTKSCDYLVVGDLGSAAWSFGNYGNKVKKAMEWKAKGTSIKIISEATLYG